MADGLVGNYRAGLETLLAKGESVPSVRGSKSKASGFGRGDRPWLEIIGYQSRFRRSRPGFVATPALPIHQPYLFGLLAWTLGGRNDLESLSYYRTAARDYSDDGLTLCGAFGARLFGLNRKDGQMQAIIDRLRGDPASRRTFAPICTPLDNIQESREYPCAAGVQLFLRNDELHWLTVMRAQQALTIWPYDVFLFSALQCFAASALRCAVGDYTHFAGTFHIYENERPLAERVIGSDIQCVTLPAVPPGAALSVADELIRVEQEIRAAAVAGDERALATLEARPLRWEFTGVARGHLLEFARRSR